MKLWINTYVLEEVANDLHDTRAELHNTDFRRLLHLANAVQETVLGHTGVRVDEQDVVTNTDVAISPGARVVLENFTQAALVLDGLVGLSPAIVTVDLEQLLLDTVGKVETVVHVTVAYVSSLHRDAV